MYSPFFSRFCRPQGIKDYPLNYEGLRGNDASSVFPQPTIHVMFIAQERPPGKRRRRPPEAGAGTHKSTQSSHGTRRINGKERMLPNVLGFRIKQTFMGLDMLKLSSYFSYHEAAERMRKKEVLP